MCPGGGGRGGVSPSGCRAPGPTAAGPRPPPPRRPSPKAPKQLAQGSGTFRVPSGGASEEGPRFCPGSLATGLLPWGPSRLGTLCGCRANPCSRGPPGRLQGHGTLGPHLWRLHGPGLSPAQLAVVGEKGRLRAPPLRPPLRPPGGDWGRHGRRGRGRGSPGSGCPKPPVGSGLARERLLGWPQGLPLASAGSPLAEELQLSVGSPESPCRRRAETKDHSLAAFRVPRLPATPSHSPGTQLHPQGREQRVAFCLWVCLAVSLHLSLSLSFSRSLPRLPRLSVQVRRSRGIEAGGCDTTQQSRISHRSFRRNSTPPVATGKGVKASESGGAARGAAAPSSDAQDS